MIQFFGQFGNYHSFAYVSREYCKALRSYGLPFMVWGTDKAIGYHYIDAPWANGLSEEVPVAVCVDYPPPADRFLKGYDKKVLITVCESDRIPKNWVQSCNNKDLVIVPSVFCARAFLESGVKAPILIVRHGISPAFLEHGIRKSKGDDWTRLLHIAGTTTFHKRKGTGILLHAFSRVLEDFPRTVLHLRTPQRPGLLDLLSKFNLERHVIIDNDILGLDPRLMAGYLCNFDAVLQPSRGEGFGITPLEARCLGIPVMLTDATGHTEHIAPECDVIVNTGPPERLDTQGNSVGRCPTIELESVESALRELLGDLNLYTVKTRQWAQDNREKWIWGNKLLPGVKQIRRLWRDASGPMKLGSTAGIG